MHMINFELLGACLVPEGTIEVEGVINHFRLPGGQIVSIQAVIEMSSAIDADDHRYLAYDEAVALGLYLDCDERRLDLASEPD